MNESFWPNVDDLKEILIPQEILIQQSNYLKQATKGKLYVEVIESNSYKKMDLMTMPFQYEFILRSKFMDTFGFKILTIFHDETVYPVKIVLDEAIQEELSELDIIEASDEDEFKDTLKTVIGSDRVKNVMSVLLKMSKNI